MVILFIWILLSVSLVIGCIKVHNTIIKGLFGILAGLCITVLCFVGIFYYLIVFKVSNVDTSVSSDGEYSLTMQAVGEPLFFGPADGQFILKNNTNDSIIFFNQFKYISFHKRYILLFF